MSQAGSVTIRPIRLDLEDIESHGSVLIVPTSFNGPVSHLVSLFNDAVCSVRRNNI
jgi:hypothetical protein